jgi:hypothetical protein
VSPNIPCNSIARSPGAKLKMSLEIDLPDLLISNIRKPPLILPNVTRNIKAVR